jgi:hypothetical protein
MLESLGIRDRNLWAIQAHVAEATEVRHHFPEISITAYRQVNDFKDLQRFQG